MSRTMNVVLVAMAIIALSGCAPNPTETMPISPSDRVTIKRIGVIEDDLAFGDRRGIYLIVDTKTDKEFIGVSGVGITEVGRHSSGKATAPDER